MDPFMHRRTVAAGKSASACVSPFVEGTTGGGGKG